MRRFQPAFTLTNAHLPMREQLRAVQGAHTATATAVTIAMAATLRHARLAPARHSLPVPVPVPVPEIRIRSGTGTGTGTGRRALSWAWNRASAIHASAGARTMLCGRTIVAAPSTTPVTTRDRNHVRPPSRLASRARAADHTA